MKWLGSPNSGDPPKLCVSGRWKAYSPFENSPGGVHEKSVLLVFNANAIARSPEQAKRAAQPIFSRLIFIAWIRFEGFRERIFERIANEDLLSVCASLILGQSRPRSPTPLLRILGFVHLLSVTGIHLYALATLWKRMIGAFARVFGLPALAGLRIAELSSAVLWILAWLLSGARRGMLRPLVIAGARASAKALGLRWRKWAPLAVALGAELPLGLIGFSASGRVFYALAVGGGMMGEGHLGVSLGAFAFSALFEAWEEGLISIATPLLSFLTLPVFAGFLFPVLFLSSFLPDAIGAPLGALAVKTMTHLVLILLRLDLWLPSLFVVPRWALVLALIGTAVLVLLLPRRKLVFILLPAVLAAALFIRAFGEAIGTRPGASRLQLASFVEQLDVGQGDSALVASWGDTPSLGLIDTGSAHALSEAEWLRIFSRRNATSVDWIAFSHLDEDHSGGITRLARILPVGCVSAPLPELESKRGRKFASKLLSLGIQVRDFADFSHGCVPWPVLPPPPAGKASPKANANMAAFFVPLQGGGFYLGAGDADRKAEPRIGRWARRLADSAQTGPRVLPRILKISHHGSRSSSAPEFLALIRPTEVWISSGVGNRYGHPHAEILRELSRLGIPVRRTDLEGAIRSKAARHPPRTHPP